MESASQYQQIMADNPNNPFAGDDRLWVRFEYVAVKSDEIGEDGLPVFHQVPHIEIRTPGDRDNVLYRPMTELDKGRFKRRFEEWLKTQNDVPLEGIPLSEVAIFSKAQVEAFRYQNIYTLQALCELSDGACSKSPGMQTSRQKARDYLDHALKGKEASRLLKEKEELENRFKSQEQAVKDQAAVIAELKNQLLALAAAKGK